MTVGDPLSTTGLPRPDAEGGVFETLLVVDGQPIELDAHLDRLAASARELYGDGVAARIAGPARALATAEAAKLSPAERARPRAGADAPEPEAPLARLRLTLIPDGAGRLDLSAASAPVLAGTAFPSVDGGAALASVAVPGGLGAHKWADRRLLAQAAPLLARQQRGSRPASEAAVPLIVDADGTVLEAERANVFAVLDGVLVTPPLDGRLLPGIARRRVLEIARELALPLAERPFGLSELPAAAEVLLTGSVRGIEPVATIDGAPCRSGGDVTERLAAALRARWL